MPRQKSLRRSDNGRWNRRRGPSRHLAGTAWAFGILYVIDLGRLGDGPGTAFAVYMLDRLDLFGVHAQSQHEQVMARLNEIIEISHERIKEAAAIFDPPVLPHLT